LTWTSEQQIHGRIVHLKDFPKGHQLKLFRLPLSTERTDYIVTNDISQFTIEAVQEVSGFRWKIEQFHRESKQLTGMESCQCRKQRIQRNHIGCAIPVWVRLKQLAYQTEQTTSIKLSKICCQIIWSGNLKIRPLKCFLRKS